MQDMEQSLYKRNLRLLEDNFPEHYKKARLHLILNDEAMEHFTLLPIDTLEWLCEELTASELANYLTYTD